VSLRTVAITPTREFNESSTLRQREALQLIAEGANHEGSCWHTEWPMNVGNAEVTSGPSLLGSASVSYFLGRNGDLNMSGSHQPGDGSSGNL